MLATHPHHSRFSTLPPVIPAFHPVIPAKAGIRNVAGAAATVREREVAAPPSHRKAATAR